MEITAASVQALRKATGAGMMDCKKALAEAGGNADKATEILRKTGAMKAAKRQDREAREGLVHSYIHMGGKIGVLIELNCETDFVARTEVFQQLAKDLAMHIAASSPDYIRQEDVPAEVLEKEKEIYREQASQSDKPEKVWDKIAEGRLEKFYQEACLLDQPFVKNPDTAVGQLIREVAGKVGENIVIRRFTRFQLGQ
ncbi:MAG: elongation factor Ts [Candidatus Glassbacteria bacterium RIFCSPLOWO2_12_FULL_58_11]|uniref:Elongation factor Ts n=1 Tax=Candidatus Glassbacteria bacterium RIFCSPLOWO2_12_FULL_58_11 TaxID=1817867 RepID=A0A1F5YWJ5_9BACT|nr:MAG: elongation factor Ts [Candidatus Glassbacteria bacterium RIFCSPLOWO2_12_FULL_58_11]